MSTATAKFSTKEYEHMISVGAFDTRWGHNIELIHGELCEMFPINFHHATILDYLTRWSVLVEIYRKPTNGGYQKTQAFKAGDMVAPLAFPKTQLNVSEMFATLETP